MSHNEASPFRQSVLITGAGSGLGKLTAEALLAAGHHVFATMTAPEGRDEGAARELEATARASGSLTVLAMDVTQDASVASAFARVAAHSAALDAVINNAGVGAMGLAEGYTPAQLGKLLDVNVTGVQRVNRAALALMRPRRAGLLVHVSTSLARLSLPCFGLYAASKCALEMLAETYRWELAALGIDSVILEPAVPYPTRLGASALAPADPARLQDYGPLAGLAGQMVAGLGRLFASSQAPDPREVPEAILRLLRLPFGQRPVRTLVGAASDELVTLTNTLAQHQEAFLRSQGLSGLLTPRHPTT
jgi:NAD(P)-dependent dehydrogenase (short-subunit alcohol dehydrogenase family)